MQKDYKYSLILGLTIGVFATPVISGLGLAAKYGSMLYILSIIFFPALAWLGLWICKALFYKIPVLWQFTKFGLVGVANTTINFGILNGLIRITGQTKGFPIYLIASVAFLGALINSYIWNSHWSFENKNPRTAKEFIEFFLVTFIGLQLNSIIVYWITTNINHPQSITAKQWANIANVVATLFVMFWNFFGFKYLVFKVSAKQSKKERA